MTPAPDDKPYDAEPNRITDAEPVAFLADTHDRLDLLNEQVRVLREAGIQYVVHLGDVTMADTMSRLTAFEIHYVYGNGDHRNAVAEVVEDAGGTYYGEEDRVVIGENMFHIHHGVEHGKSYGLARGHTGVDYVFHGHWHNTERNQYDNGEVLNPGSEGIWIYYPDDDRFEHRAFENFAKPRPTEH